MVYPNPSTDKINLNFSLSKDSDVNIYVFDMTGSIVKSTSYGFAAKANHNTTISVDDMTSGLYFVSIQANNSIITRKIQVVN